MARKAKPDGKSPSVMEQIAPSGPLGVENTPAPRINPEPDGTLGGITAEILSILRAIDIDAEQNGGGEIDPHLEEQLQFFESQLPSKIDDYVYVVRKLQDYAEECMRESQRLATRARAWNNKVTWLKGRILATLLAIDCQKLKTARNTVSVCKAGGVQSLQLTDDASKIPDEYLTSRVVIEPDREKIRKELDAGIELEFARLAERTVYLKIS